MGRQEGDPAVEAPRRKRRKWPWIVGTLLALAAIAYVETRTSWIQARLFSAWSSGITYRVRPEAESEPWQGSRGPFDVRRGYTRLADISAAMDEHGYRVDAQARISGRFRRSLDLGLYPVYPEQPQAGLTIADREGEVLYRSLHPAGIYESFDAIPPPVVEALVFIENRELLESDMPNRNPVVEWDRFARSIAGLLATKLGAETSRAGGSTLATQIEKYKHSPGGLTRTPRDKLVQMATATVRAYRAGPETADERERIVVDYLNSVPLAAVAGYGEVLGLKDALRVWFGLEPERANELLH
ncbi:MAG: transglycosylase domain-containing protein, partial [Acidobacteriota bacterium]|nr:transglycosylase domain-containing protein [Acidobacteriota bacterium]